MSRGGLLTQQKKKVAVTKRPLQRPGVSSHRGPHFRPSFPAPGAPSRIRIRRDLRQNSMSFGPWGVRGVRARGFTAVRGARPPHVYAHVYTPDYAHVDAVWSPYLRACRLSMHIFQTTASILDGLFFLDLRLVCLIPVITLVYS